MSIDIVNTTDLVEDYSEYKLHIYSGGKNILTLDASGKLTLDPQNVDEAAGLFVKNVRELYSQPDKSDTSKDVYISTLEEKIRILTDRINILESR